MKKKMLLLVWALGMIVCDVHVASALNTTSIATNATLGAMISLLPEKSVSSTGAFLLFAIMNTYMRQFNLLEAIPSYIVGGIAGNLTKQYILRDEPKGYLQADYEDGPAAMAADC